MIECIIVGLGGFVGAVLRYIATLVPIKNSSPFPFTTLAINIVGSLCIGLIALWMSKNANVDSRLILFLKVGICGGFTTFSTFSLETGELIKSGHTWLAVLYVALSVLFGVLAALLPSFATK